MCFVWSRLKHTQKDTHVKVEQYYAIYWRTLQFHSSVKLKLEDVSGSASQGLSQRINIARGTTDPEIDSVTWIKFSNNMAPLALVANLASRWRHLY